jgi:Putative metal-binding motif
MKACGMAVGICMQGNQNCDDTGQWSAECVGAVGPKPETCDGVSDENCDGKVDEGCECTNGKTMECGSNVGECAAGTKTCVNGKWGATCEGERKPGSEACDGGKDEDCDGQVDEACQCTNGAQMECGSDQGACAKGNKTCTNGKWSATCEGERRPGTEACDGQDNDCDGRTDENVQNACGGCMRLANPPGASCSAGQFGCRVSGQYECAANKEATTCPARAGTPIDEACDGKDNDCDGRMDEGLQNKCGGSCRDQLPGVPNDPCGTADSCTGFRPKWQCDGQRLVCRACTYNCVRGDGTGEETSTDPCGWVANELHNGPDGTPGTCLPQDRACL